MQHTAINYLLCTYDNGIDNHLSVVAWLCPKIRVPYTYTTDDDVLLVLSLLYTGIDNMNVNESKKEDYWYNLYIAGANRNEVSRSKVEHTFPKTKLYGI